MNTERKHLWELDCFSKDVILTTAFPWSQLSRLCRQLYPTTEVLPGENEEQPDYQVWTFVHGLCHCPTTLARTLDQLLQGRYAREAAYVSRRASWELERWLRSTEVHQLQPVAGWIWALASDPRQELASLLREWLGRIKYAALSTLAAGKQENLEPAAVEAS